MGKLMSFLRCDRILCTCTFCLLTIFKSEVVLQNKSTKVFWSGCRGFCRTAVTLSACVREQINDFMIFVLELFRLDLDSLSLCDIWKHYYYILSALSTLNRCLGPYSASPSSSCICSHVSTFYLFLRII